LIAFIIAISMSFAAIFDFHTPLLRRWLRQSCRHTPAIDAAFHAIFLLRFLSPLRRRLRCHYCRRRIFFASFAIDTLAAAAAVPLSYATTPFAAG
jgi:prepilin signal peptidase PulO-like enzyme (type II secretory pathway)